MANILGIATNKKIIELINDYRSGLLVLKPRFQRKLVWNKAHKAAFIETIIRKLPFPEVYFTDGEMDLKNQKTTIWVVDGQQRLNAILSYIDGNLDLTKTDVKPFADLNPTEQTDFFNYVVVVRSLGKLTDIEIKDIFRRINSVNYALNAVEISNALYEGEFISLARSIAESESFTNIELLSDQEVKRMKDVEFVLLVLCSVELGVYFTQTSEVEDLIKLYNDEYQHKEIMNEAVQKALLIINRLGLDYDSIWYKKTTMFSLLTELGKIIYNNISINIAPAILREKLIGLESEIINNKTSNPDSNKYAKFYKHMFQQTTSKTGRCARGTLIEEILKN
jgi:hypothetical protein